MKKVKCPNCKKMSEYGPNNPYRPFCSERCKTLDLGAWAEGDYRIPDNEQLQEVNSDGEDGSNEDFSPPSNSLLH